MSMVTTYTSRIHNIYRNTVEFDSLYKKANVSMCSTFIFKPHKLIEMDTGRLVYTYRQKVKKTISRSVSYVMPNLADLARI